MKTQTMKQHTVAMDIQRKSLQNENGSVRKRIHIASLLVLTILCLMLAVVPASAQNAVAPTARRAMASRDVAARLAAARAGNKSRAPAPLHNTPASPQGLGLYDNGPINGTTDAWTINFGYIVSDSFTLTSNSAVQGFDFGAWEFPGDVLTSVDWSITSSPNGGSVYGSGTVSDSDLTDTFISTNQYGYNIDNISVSGLNVSPGSGTFYLNLTNAATPSGDPVFWDENSGVGCGGDDGKGGGCPSQAYESAAGTIASESFSIAGCTDTAVKNLQADVPIPKTSRIYVSGPYVGGAQMVEDFFDPAHKPVVLVVGHNNGEGSFCVYLIDDDVDPNAPPDQPLPLTMKLNHPVRFAWTNQDYPSDYGVAEANNTLTVNPYPPGTPPRPFVYRSFKQVNEVPTVFGSGEFAAEPAQKPGGQELQETVSPASDDGCLHEALVIDGGDKKSYLTKGIASAANADGALMAEWLSNEPYGFGVTRRSQYWGTRIPDYPRGEERESFLEEIRSYVNSYSIYKTGKNCHHEFFLYVAAHGGTLGSFYLFDGDGSGESDYVSYDELFEELNKFPTDNDHKTTVYVMFDACYSGLAVTAAQQFRVGQPPDGHWALQAMSSVDRQTAPNGHSPNRRSGTEWFVHTSIRPATMTTGFESMTAGLKKRSPRRLRDPNIESKNLFKLDP